MLYSVFCKRGYLPALKKWFSSVHIIIHVVVVIVIVVVVVVIVVCVSVVVVVGYDIGCQVEGYHQEGEKTESWKNNLNTSSF